MILVKYVLNALDEITKGRCIMTPIDFAYNNPYVATKSSGIPGKAITETPGLIYGNPLMKVKKIADACNSGGVLLKDYLNLYDIAVFELHEALHGLHPGIPWIHGIT